MIMSLPKVSVVITCYNYGEYVGSALESVFAQTFQDFEIILIDDGSTDDSEKIIRSFLVDNRLKYYRHTNSGQAIAKNRGIVKAKGEFIAFLDADDKWEKAKLEKQIPLFSDRDIGVVFSRAKYIDDKDQLLNFSLTDRYLQPRSGRVTNYLYIDNFIPFSSSVVRKKCISNLGSFDETLPMGIDWDLWLRLSTECLFSYVDEPLLLYRVGHAGQMSKNAIVRHNCADRIMDKFNRNYPGFVDTKTQKKARYYTLCNRSEYYSVRQPWQGICLSFDAIKQKPWHVKSYQGFLLACRHLLIYGIK